MRNSMHACRVMKGEMAELPLFAEAVQSDAKKVGIKVNLKNVDYNILFDIGKLFPDNDSKYKDINSLIMTKEVVRLMK